MHQILSSIFSSTLICIVIKEYKLLNKDHLGEAYIWLNSIHHQVHYLQYFELNRSLSSVSMSIYSRQPSSNSVVPYGWIYAGPYLLFEIFVVFGSLFTARVCALFDTTIVSDKFHSYFRLPLFLQLVHMCISLNNKILAYCKS